MRNSGRPCGSGVPARSNDFQRLVFLVKQQFQGATRVTESKLLVDLVTGDSREVDVVIEGEIAGLPVMASIECRDHQRTADVRWVDEMSEKHRRLPTNALVLASRSGFSDGARKAAERLGVQLLSLQENEDVDLKPLLTPGGHLWAKTFDLSVEKVVAITIEGEGVPPKRVRLFPSNNLYATDGDYRGMALGMVEAFLRDPRIPERLARDATEEHKWFQFSVEGPTLKTGSPVCLQELDSKRYVPIGSLEILGGCRVSVGEFRMRQGRLGPMQVSWGTADLDGKSAMAVMSVDDREQVHLTLDLRTKTPSQDRRRKEPSARRRKGKSNK